MPQVPLPADLRQLLPRLLPGGAFTETDYMADGLLGAQGRGCVVSLADGAWSDTSSGSSGPDVASLVAAVEGLDPKASETRLAPVMVVEDESAATAARLLSGPYDVVTISDSWKTLAMRRLLLWANAGSTHADWWESLATIGAFHPESKAIPISAATEVSGPADAVSKGWQWAEFSAWARRKAVLLTKAQGAFAVSVGGPAIAINVTGHSPDAASVSSMALWDQLGLHLSSNGQPLPNADNTLRVLERHPPYAGMVWWDEFRQRLMTQTDDGPTDWPESQTISLLIRYQRELGMGRLGKHAVEDALVAYGRARTRNELTAWLGSLAWDKVPRLETFFQTCLGTHDSPYIRAASRNFWLQMVARALKPGCRAHHVVYLIGSQGIGKSTALETIGGAWYVEAAGSILDKDFYLAMRGKLLVEIAELSAFRRADQEQIKAVITRQVDTYRAPYDRAAADHPRRCVFACTTNDNTPFLDPTGARRFWPVPCGRIDLKAVTELREPCFAEAVEEIKNGADWYLMPHEQTTDVQEDYRRSDVWEEIIASWLKEPDNAYREELRLQDVALECLHIEIARLDRPTEMRIAHALRAIGWEKHVMRRHGIQAKWWTRKEKGPQEN